MLNLKNAFTKAIFVFVAISNFAYASDAKFYLGLDASRQDLNLDKSTNYLYSSIKAKDLYKNNSINPSIFAGVDVLDFLKIETSYTQSSTTKKNILVYNDGTTSALDDTNYQIKTKTIALDFKPYIKINDNFSAFAIVGASYNKININEKDTILDLTNSELINSELEGSINKLAPSIGFGFEYFASPNLALRTQAKYTHLNVKTDQNSDFLLGKIQGMSQVNAGIAYYF